MKTRMRAVTAALAAVLAAPLASTVGAATLGASAIGTAALGATALMAGAAHAGEQESEAYAPMAPFAKLDGRVLRGEGEGPNGQPIVDYAIWESILGGRAFQSTHRLEDGTYGGRTIFFYDEAAKQHVFHYFTTAGFHTTGVIDVTEAGFAAVEKVIGHEQFDEVRSFVRFVGDTVEVSSAHVDKNGVATPTSGIVYTDYKGDVDLFEKSYVRFKK